MSKIKDIASGYFRLAQSKLGILPPDIESVAIERFSTCLECENYLHDDDRCNVCGCVMSAKARCPECECPLQKWVAMNRNEENGAKIQ